MIALFLFRGRGICRVMETRLCDHYNYMKTMLNQNRTQKVWYFSKDDLIGESVRTIQDPIQI